MASANNYEVNLRLECSICFNTFEKPKLLNCMHTFCEKCLNKVLNADDGNGDVIKCPICRGITKVCLFAWIYICIEATKV